MKRFFFFAVCLLSALSVLSCTPEERAELIESLNGKSSSVASGPIVTVGADYVSAISAVLKGEMNLGAKMSPDLVFGIMWSEYSGVLPMNSKKVPAEQIDAKPGSPNSYCYQIVLAGLKPDRTYYFRSYLTQNNEDTYGETKSFTTKKQSSLVETLDATEIIVTHAVLNGRIDYASLSQAYENIEYGFYWGVSESELSNYVKGGAIAENTYSANLTNLSPVTQHWYKAYLKVDDQTFYGNVKTFTTLGKPVTKVSLDKTEYVFHTIGATLMLTPTVSPSDASDKSVSWSSSNESVATVDQTGKVTAVGNGTATITVTTTDQSKTATCAITVAQWVTSITLDKTSLVLVEGKSEILTVTSVNPDNANDKTVTWSSSNTSVATVSTTGVVSGVASGAAKITVSANDGSGVFASCAVRVGKPYTAVAGEAVDLGLSVKWSSMNLGATSPTGYGDYFAWGEIVPKDNYSWVTYEFSNGSSFLTMTKYNNSIVFGTVDNKTFEDYDYEDDAARQALGGSWRMPTNAEWAELRNTSNCTWTWTTQNGINGYKVTSKKNEASIFLPAAGYRYGTNFLGVGSSGSYWSSSLYSVYPLSAYYVYFISSGVDRSFDNRSYGYSVRPVSE